MPVVEAIVTAAEVKALYDEAKRDGWSDRFIAALRRRQNLLLLGATGVGKSNFLKALTQELPEAIDVMNRTIAVEKQGLRLGRQPFVTLDTPGDVAKRTQRQRAYAEHMRKRRRAIVNVVSYGYHEYRAGIDEAIEDGQIARGYLARHRQVELDMVEEWANYLDPGREEFVLTVISKADLWWTQRSRVFQHYEKGRYDQRLAELGYRNRCVVAHASVFHKFYGAIAGSGTFDDIDRIGHKAQVLAALLKLTAAE